MSIGNLCFIDFGFEHVSLLIANIDDGKFVDIPLILREKINLPAQRLLNISDRVDVFETMLLLIDKAEKKLGINIYSVILMIKSNAINLFFTQFKIDFQKQKNVSYKDEEILSTQALKAFKLSSGENYNILDLICNNFIVDGKNKVKNPYKMICKSLTLNATVIGIKQTAISLFRLFMERFKVHVEHYLSSCVCVSGLLNEILSCDDNFLFIDFGSGATEYCVYRKGCLTNLGFVDLGGIDITRDLAEEMSINLNKADDAKKNINNNEVQNTDSVITKYVVNEIEEVINARLKEIVENIFGKLNENGGLNFFSFKKIYIYGNVCGYKDIQNIVSECFHSPVAFLDVSFLTNHDFFYKKVKQEHLLNDNIQLFGAVHFYIKNLKLYKKARHGFLFKIPSKISCFLKDLLY